MTDYHISICTYTHTVSCAYIHTYKYIYLCMCVCMCKYMREIQVFKKMFTSTILYVFLKNYFPLFY